LDDFPTEMLMIIDNPLFFNPDHVDLPGR